MKSDNNIFLSLLKELKVPHTRDYTLRTYEEHPYKYTFYGLKLLCESYGIETEGVLITDKDDLKRLDTPFIAQYAEDYVLIKNISDKKVTIETYGTTYSLPVDEFKKHWSGNTLLLYPDEKSCEPDYQSHKHRILCTKFENSAVVICGLGLITFCTYSRPILSIVEILSILLYLLGSLTCVMLLAQQLKIRNAFIESVCHAFKQSSCSNVLESNAAKFKGKYSWSEIGFTYFSVNFFFLLFSDQFTTILAYISVLSLPYSVWSVWYQRHISQWCPLCLIVQAILIFQFVLYSIGGIYSLPLSLNPVTIMALLMGYIGTVIIVNRFLPLLTKSKELQQSTWQYRHLKMNDLVFAALLKSEKEHSVDASSVIFGDTKGNIRITIFSNPYCNPCAAMHKRLQTLVKAKGCQIQYFFTSFKPEWNIINKYMIAAYLQIGPEKAWDIYSQWYDKGKLQKEKFFEPYHLDITTEEVTAEFERHEQWHKKSGFNSTPTILINGHKLPYGYTVEDIQFFLN